MKRILLIIFCICVLITGCQKEKTKTERKDVVINLPTDNTINGYRDKKPSPDSIPKDEVSLESKPTVSVSYCGNKNSKVFHKSSCSSVKKTKEENKIYLKTKEDFIKNGYSPCKMCNP